MRFHWLHLCCLLATARLNSAYDFVREYKGSSFFQEWNFYGHWDNLTLGDTNWVDAPTAWQKNLVKVNSFGNAVIGVDNNAWVEPNMKRDAVRLESQATYDLGTLLVIDVFHIPSGCGTWGSIWTMGPDWPLGGEIDIIEGINRQNFNQVSIHTTQGCSRDPNGWQTGEGGILDCSTPSGCTVKQTTDPSQPSFGDTFAAAGGGVWVVQYDIQGVFIWFWTRAQVPPQLYNPPEWGMDISGFGTPVAAYPSSTCNMLSYFKPQQLAITTTFCGNWAGVPTAYAETCAGEPSTTGQPATGACYWDNVVGPGSPRFDQSYFEISHIRAFTTGTNGPTALANHVPAPTDVETSNSSSTSLGLSSSWTLLLMTSSFALRLVLTTVA